jgi:hypothetical protein
MLFELLEPLSDTSSAGPDVPGDGRDRFAVGCQKDHARAAAETGFAALLPSDRPKIIPFFLRQSKFHTENIGKELCLSVSKLMARGTRLQTSVTRWLFLALSAKSTRNSFVFAVNGLLSEGSH